MWKESIIHGTDPPTRQDIDAFCVRLFDSIELQNQIWYRYMLTRHHQQRFKAWLRESWYFTNAAEYQIDHVIRVVTGVDNVLNTG